MTPLPSLFDKMIEAAKRQKRSTSVQLKSGVDDDPFALSSIPEEPEESSSDPVPVKVPDVQKPSDIQIEVEYEPEPEPPVHQPSPTDDHMDFEDTPIVFSEPVYLNPSPVPIVPPSAPIFPLVHVEVVTHLLPPNPLDICTGPPSAP